MLLRPAEPQDALPVARVHVKSWQAAYRGLLPDDYLNGLSAEDRAQKYDFSGRDPLKPRTLVASKAGSICGFATTSPWRDADLETCGELLALYVDPHWWGRGVGLALISAARGHLVGQGFRNAALWLLAGNARADRFYRNDGWEPDGVRRTQTVWGITVDEVRYRRELGPF